MARLGPVYVRGVFAQAACALLDHLGELGIECEGVGYESKRRKRELVVHLKRRDDVELLPVTYYGFAVKGHVVGGHPS